MKSFEQFFVEKKKDGWKNPLNMHHMKMNRKTDRKHTNWVAKSHQKEVPMPFGQTKLDAAKESKGGIWKLTLPEAFWISKKYKMNIPRPAKPTRRLGSTGIVMWYKETRKGPALYLVKYDPFVASMVQARKKFKRGGRRNIRYPKRARSPSKPKFKKRHTGVITPFTESINKILNEQTVIKIGIFPGSFKPMHLGHFETLKRMTKENNKNYVFVSNKPREDITPLKTLQLWDLYKPLLKNNVEIKISEISPVKDTYDLIESINKSPEAGNTVITVYAGTDEDFNSRFSNLFSNPAKYTSNLLGIKKGSVVTIPPTHEVLKAFDPNKLSASAIRSAIKHNNREAVMSAMPNVDQEKIWSILKT